MARRMLRFAAGCDADADAAPLPPPSAAAPMPGLQQVWVQAVAGPGWAVRALTGEACPTMRWAGAWAGCCTPCN